MGHQIIIQIMQKVLDSGMRIRVGCPHATLLQAIHPM
jgi:hypothetical protein